MATVAPSPPPATAAAAESVLTDSTSSHSTSSLEATELLQKLSLDSQTKAPENTKKPSATSVQSNDRSATPVPAEFVDPSMCYVPSGYPYYYGGYEGSMADWDEYYRYFGQEGVYGDMYGYGYTPYGPYSPAGSPLPTMGHDGQLYGPQQYQYPSHYYQSPTPTGPQATNNGSATKGEISTSATADQAPLSVETTNGNVYSSTNANVNGTSNGSMEYKTAPASVDVAMNLNTNGSSGKGAASPATGYQDSRFGYDGVKSPIPWLDAPVFPDNQQYRPATSGTHSSTARSNNIQLGRNQNLHSYPSYVGLQSPRPGMGRATGYMSKFYPNNSMYGYYGGTTRMGNSYGYNGYDSRTNRNGWVNYDNKYKSKGRGNGFLGNDSNVDGFNELNRGPRARGFKNQKGVTCVTLAVKGQDIPPNDSNGEKDVSSVIPDREQYNKEDFPVEYTNAKFFIIKSYSEDDVHKSIKYSVWASTPNGNKKLDAGYCEAQEKCDGCPVFLFFSVNTSGQFVGLAEMVGPVDFEKSVEYWQQDKWNGCFPVKWHIVKDIPNNLLKLITLANNENKPVTNSRDTQEVKLERGLEMLKIFKNHSSKTSILDDFEFYEARQKTVQEKKAQHQKEQLQKQVWEGKTIDVVSDDKEKERTNGNGILQNSADVALTQSEELTELQVNGEHKQTTECELTKGVKAAVLTENKAVANGVINGIVESQPTFHGCIEVGVLTASDNQINQCDLRQIYSGKICSTK